MKIENINLDPIAVLNEKLDAEAYKNLDNSGRLIQDFCHSHGYFGLDAVVFVIELKDLLDKLADLKEGSKS